MSTTNNPLHHSEVVAASKCVLSAAPLISNKQLAGIIHTQFVYLPAEEVKRSIDLAIFHFNNASPNIKRNYKSLNR